MQPFPSPMMQGGLGALCVWNSATWQGNHPGGAGGNEFHSGNFSSALGEACAVATVGKNLGKFYFEILAGPYFPSGAFGLSPQVNSVAPFLYGGPGLGIQYASDGSLTDADTFGTISGYGPTYASGDIIQIAVDLTNNLIWFGKNNTFIGNPVAGTGGKSIIHTLYYPAITLAATGTNVNTSSGIARWTTGSFTYTPPIGFSQWR